MTVGDIIKQIKKQTGIKDEEKEYGNEDVLNVIEKLVEKQSQRNEENFDKRQKEENKKYQEKEKTPEELEATQKRKKQVIVVPITDKMKNMAHQWAEKVMAEKR